MHAGGRSAWKLSTDYTAAKLWALLRDDGYKTPGREFGGVIFVREGYRAVDCPVPALPTSDSDDD